MAVEIERSGILGQSIFQAANLIATVARFEPITISQSRSVSVARLNDLKNKSIISGTESYAHQSFKQRGTEN